VSRRTFIRCRCNSSFQTFLALVCLAGFAAPALGQEALRLSLSGDLAAESRQQAQNTIGYYNLLTGPVAWRFSSGLEMEYNSNVGLGQNGESDFISSPNLDAQMHWPISLVNSLDLTLGVGYSVYALNSGLDQFYINPGSSLSFNIYAGHWVFNLHDQINISENGYQNPGFSNNGNNSVLQNDVGADGLWNLNKLLLKIGYDHGNYVQLASALQQLDSASDNFFLQGGARIRPEITAGLETGFGLLQFDQSSSAQPDADQWNSGAFCSVQISQYIEGRLDLGYTSYLPAATSTNQATGDFSGYYFQLSVEHRVSKFLNYSFTAGRMTDFALFGQPVNYYFVRLEPNWLVLKDITLSTPFSWEDGTELYNAAASFTQYSGGVNITRNLTKKLSGTLSYQFVRENSSSSSLNYTVQIVSLNLLYKF